MEPVSILGVAGITAVVTAAANWGVTKATLNGTVQRVQEIAQQQERDSKDLAALKTDIMWIKGALEKEK